MVSVGPRKAIDFESLHQFVNDVLQITRLKLLRYKNMPKEPSQADTSIPWSV